ncbi:interleukin-17A [Pseudophryne corroboree]|uniref:interleukin-17A n=1 Tax=Pseudophryne corroboree TaxID=495146 RepID=UPI0030815500
MECEGEAGDQEYQRCLTHLTLLLLLLGVTALTSAHSLALHHPKKEGCPLSKDTSFPSTIRVSLNMSGQAHPPQGDVRKRSVSPWDYSHDANINRIPHVIAEAKCRHQGCLDAYGNVDLSLNSAPIRQEILVLHREVKGCAQTFKLEKKIVTVGCTCVRPIVHEQQ